jgi:nucleotide-binding universal stress UspA family protein
MIRRILVPLDGSAFGEYALLRGIGLARRHGATLDLVHVHEVTSLVYMEGVPLLDASVELEGMQSDRGYLDALVGRVRSNAVTVTTTLLDGPTVPALEAHIAQSGADLVVMTTHGRGPLSRAWLGSVADGLARHTTRPVLLIRPPEGAGHRNAPHPDLAAAPTPFRRVLLPFDDERNAQPIVDSTLEVAERDATLVVLHVAPRSVSVAGRARDVDASTSDRVVEAARQALEKTVAGLRAKGRDVRLEVDVARDVATCILETAARERADLIALTTHGQNALSRLLLGSVTDKVLRAASVPVLMRRPAGPQGAEAG